MYVELTDYDKNTFIVAVIYRPPGLNMELFNKRISEVLNILRPEKTNCIPMGDLNIDLLKTDSQPHSRDFYNIMKSYHFFPKITKRHCTLRHSH